MVKKIKVEGEEFHEKKIKPSNANITVEDIKAIMQETSDVKERILEAVSNKLFDKNLLNMISRLDNNMAFYVIKHLIINGFYYRYYSSLTYKITFEPVYNNKKECVYPFL